MNLVKRHFFTTIEKQKKIRSVTKCNDAGFLVEIAIFTHAKKYRQRLCFFYVTEEARGGEPGAGVNDRPVDGQSRALTERQREETPLASDTLKKHKTRTFRYKK